MLTLLFNQFRRLLASVGFTAGADASYTAHIIAEASLTEGGTGTVATAGATLLHAQVSFDSVATASFAAHLAQEAQLALAGNSVFSAVGRMAMNAAIAFGGTADVSVGTVPEVQQPTLGGGGGISSRTTPLRQRRPRIAYRASVAFEAEGLFAAQAHVVPAVVEVFPLPFFEPIASPLFVLPHIDSTVIGQIESIAESEPQWTEDEELVALLMFEQAA